jgi:hypothetical protein
MFYVYLDANVWTAGYVGKEKLATTEQAQTMPDASFGP